jgi:hypothetical protein
MTCSAFYESVYTAGCIGPGESCETCMLIPHLNLFLLGGICLGLLLIVISLLIKNKGKTKNG